MFKAYAGFDTYLIRGTGVEEAGAVNDSAEIMSQADEMARKLVP